MTKEEQKYCQMNIRVTCQLYKDFTLVHPNKTKTITTFMQDEVYEMNTVEMAERKLLSAQELVRQEQRNVEMTKKNLLKIEQEEGTPDERMAKAVKECIERKNKKGFLTTYEVRNVGNNHSVNIPALKRTLQKDHKITAIEPAPHDEVQEDKRYLGD